MSLTSFNNVPGFELAPPAQDLALEYNYLSNTSVWFYDARQRAEQIARDNGPIRRGEYFSDYIGVCGGVNVKKKTILFRRNGGLPPPLLLYVHIRKNGYFLLQLLTKDR